MLMPTFSRSTITSQLPRHVACRSSPDLASGSTRVDSQAPTNATRPSGVARGRGPSAPLPAEGWGVFSECNWGWSWSCANSRESPMRMNRRLPKERTLDEGKMADDRDHRHVRSVFSDDGEHDDLVPPIGEE